MPIYHCSIKNISRSGGKSAVAAASYRAGEKMEDKETGLMHDYRNKKEVVYSEIFLCENAPSEYQDRATLWNAVEEMEKQSNARLAREWEVALPNELTLEQSKELVSNFAKSLAEEGMCVDANIHWKDGNHHAHIMGTTRPIKENGKWGQKEKKDYEFLTDEKGKKVIDPSHPNWYQDKKNPEHCGVRIPELDKDGKQKIRVRAGKGEEKIWKRTTVEANDWNKKEKVEEWRKRWADHCNRYLSQDKKIDHRSYKRQGIDKIPTIHEGYAAREMRKRGVATDRVAINKDIVKYNYLTEVEHGYERAVGFTKGFDGAARDITRASEQFERRKCEIARRERETERREQEVASRELEVKEPLIVADKADKGAVKQSDEVKVPEPIEITPKAPERPQMTESEHKAYSSLAKLLTRAYDTVQENNHQVNIIKLEYKLAKGRLDEIERELKSKSPFDKERIALGKEYRECKEEVDFKKHEIDTRIPELKMESENWLRGCNEKLGELGCHVKKSAELVPIIVELDEYTEQHDIVPDQEKNVAAHQPERRRTLEELMKVAEKNRKEPEIDSEKGKLIRNYHGYKIFKKQQQYNVVKGAMQRSFATLSKAVNFVKSMWIQEQQQQI